MLVEKLPKQLQFSLVRSRRRSILEWNLEDLIAELDIELEVRESHADILNVNERHRQDEGRQFKPKGPNTASALFTMERRQQCVYCTGKHAAREWQVHTSPEERKNIHKKYFRFFVCLKSNHSSFECRSKIRCSQCKAKHHVSICGSVPSRQESKDAPISEAANNLSPSALHLGWEPVFQGQRSLANSSSKC